MDAGLHENLGRKKQVPQKLLYSFMNALPDYNQNKISSMSNTTRTNKRQKTFNKEFAEAARNGDVKTVKAMLEERKVVNVNDTQVLYKASKAGHVLVIQELIQAGADLNMSRSIQGRTAMLAACKYGRSIEVVAALLKAGANVDIRSEMVLLLLLASTSTTLERKLAIARLLLEAKCDMNV